MNCTVHRSEKKQGAYVYLAEEVTLSELPEELLGLIGQCTEVMQLNLAEREKLGTEDIKTVRQNLESQGYHLQMPPKNNVGVINYGQ